MGAKRHPRLMHDESVVRCLEVGERSWEVSPPGIRLLQPAVDEKRGEEGKDAGNERQLGRDYMLNSHDPCSLTPSAARHNDDGGPNSMTPVNFS